MMVNLPCLWGSVSQLPSSHLSIHRVPAKLLNGVMLHGKYPCRLQLLFVPESSLTYRWHQMVLNMSADASPALSGGSLYLSGVIAPLWVRTFQNPARLTNKLPETRLDSGTTSIIVSLCRITDGSTSRYSPSESCCGFSCFRSDNILQHPFGIEVNPLFENRKDNPEQFAGNHNQ